MNAVKFQEELFVQMKQQVAQTLASAGQKDEEVEQLAFKTAKNLTIKLFEICSDEELETLQQIHILNNSPLGKSVSAKLLDLIGKSLGQLFEGGQS